jgi:hypothetical protein
LLAALAAILAIGFLIAPYGGGTQHNGLGKQHASAALTAFSLNGLSPIQQRILSGFAAFEGNVGGSARTAQARPATPAPTSPAPDLCPGNLGANRRVNQNCLNVTDATLQGRSQAQDETAIAQNPGNTRQLVAGFNDYRRGDGTCGAAFSSNGGASWSDTTLPNGFTPGSAFGGVARQYWQASGDPSVAWDTRGNAYFACQVFQRGPGTTNNPDQSSAVYVFRSTGDGGGSWSFPGGPAVGTYTTDPTGLPFNDKPYMTVDSHTASPFRDRIYVTWTLFDADGTAYIYEVHSSDYGQTFSKPVVVSTTSSLCGNSYSLPTPQGTCNENQFSDPFTGLDGTLYVAYSNYNNTVSGNDNRNQILLVRSTDGGQTFSAPVKVSDYYDLPDCATYQGGQDAFRACVPEKGTGQNSVFRAANYPSGSVNPRHPGQVVVTVGSYLSRDSNPSNGCIPAGFSAATGLNLYTGVKTAGACSNKILVSVSTDGGKSFTGTSANPTTLPVVPSARGQARTDQWFQWASFTPDGTLAVSYYDRQYGSDETTGAMDVSVSASRNLSGFQVARATSSSMPLPTQFPDAIGNSVFFGDYSGLTAEAGMHPIWADTRNPDAFLCPGTGTAGVPPRVCGGIEPNGLVANDQNIFTATLGG